MKTEDKSHNSETNAHFSLLVAGTLQTNRAVAADDMSTENGFVSGSPSAAEGSMAAARRVGFGALFWLSFPYPPFVCLVGCLLFGFAVFICLFVVF